MSWHTPGIEEQELTDTGTNLPTDLSNNLTEEQELASNYLNPPARAI